MWARRTGGVKQLDGQWLDGQGSPRYPWRHGDIDLTSTKQGLTIEEFHAWAETQTEGRFELVDGEVVRMAPERLRHNLGKSEVWRVLRNALVAAGKGNAIFTDGVHVATRPWTSCSPDCIVTVGADHDLDAMSVDDPLILVEVVSPTSEGKDTVDKLAEYFELPTVAHYLVVWPKEAQVDRYRRNGMDGPCGTTLRPGDCLQPDPPGIAVDVGELLGLRKRRTRKRRLALSQRECGECCRTASGRAAATITFRRMCYGVALPVIRSGLPCIRRPESSQRHSSLLRCRSAPPRRP